MSESTAIKRRLFNGWNLISPGGFFASAAVIALAFGIFHLLGWREQTSFISGTVGSGETSVDVVAGMLYAASYFAFVVAAPILAIASVAFAVLTRLLPGGAARRPQA